MTLEQPHASTARVRGGGAPLLIGLALVVLGAWLALERAAVLDTDVAALATRWWPLALIAVGAVLLVRRRVLTGLLALLAGAAALAIIHLPGELIAPVVLITVGLLLVLATISTTTRLGGRGAAGTALLSDVDGELAIGNRERRVLAILSDVDVAATRVGARGALECVALFGSVSVTVPPEVDVALRETAVFGDVHAPSAAPAPTRTLPVSAVAVFGDVALRR